MVVKPWYRQFYLRRGDAEWASDRVSDRGYERRLEAIEGFVFIGTTMYGSPTSVVVELHDGDVGRLDSSADRVVEASISGEGSIAILNWGEVQPVRVMSVPRGSARLRTSWFGIGAAEVHPGNDRGGDEESPEHLLLQLWPAPMTDSCLVRKWVHD